MVDLLLPLPQIRTEPLRQEELGSKWAASVISSHLSDGSVRSSYPRSASGKIDSQRKVNGPKSSKYES